MKEVIDVKKTYYEDGILSTIREEYKDGGRYHRWYNRDGYLYDEIWDFKDKPSVRRSLSRFNNGNISYERWDLGFGSTRHREDGPAVTDYYKSGKIKIQEWYLNGKLHREDGPAFIKGFPNGRLEYEKWYLNGELHRADGPAVIEYYPLRDGNMKKSEEWYLNGKLHRKDGPAEIEFNTCGRVRLDGWFYGGKLRAPKPNKQDGSNKVIYKFYGWVTEEAWEVDGLLHREDSPSLTRFYMSGNIKSQEWSLNGEPRCGGEVYKIEYHENGEIAAREFVAPHHNSERCQELLRSGYYDLYRETFDQQGLLDRAFYGYAQGTGFILHREDGPAVIHYDKAGKITKEIWYCHSDQIPKPKRKKPTYSTEDGWHKQKYFPNGQLGYEQRELNGQKHTRTYYPNGRLFQEYCHLNGVLHREDGPAIIRYFRSGKIREEKWYINDVLHRKDGPAFINKYRNGGLKYEEWYQNGELHREDGPASTTYYSLRDGNAKYSDEWYQNGELHREDGPAKTTYYPLHEGNTKYLEQWFLNGKRQRKDGPVAIYHDVGENYKTEM